MKRNRGVSERGGDGVQRGRGRRGYKGQDAAWAGHFEKTRRDLGTAVLSSVTSDGNVHCSHLAEWLVPMIHAQLNCAFTPPYSLCNSHNHVSACRPNNVKQIATTEYLIPMQSSLFHSQYRILQLPNPLSHPPLHLICNRPVLSLNNTLVVFQ